MQQSPTITLQLALTELALRSTLINLQAETEKRRIISLATFMEVAMWLLLTVQELPHYQGPGTDYLLLSWT